MQADRQTDRETCRQTGRQTDGEMAKEPYTEKGMRAGRLGEMTAVGHVPAGQDNRETASVGIHRWRIERERKRIEPRFCIICLRSEDYN